MDVLLRKSIESVVAAHSSVETRYAERMRRTYQILQSYDPALAAEVFNQSRSRGSVEAESATKIQAVFRGYRARKLFTELLYEKYLEEERRQQELDLRRMEEGFLMLENLQLEAELQEKVFLSRQHEMERTHAATLIQRAYRRFKHLPTPQTVLPRTSEQPKAYVKEPPPESSHPKPVPLPHDILTPALLDTFNATGWLDTPLFSLTSPRRGLNITAECEEISAYFEGAYSLKSSDDKDSSDEDSMWYGKQHHVSLTSDFAEEEVEVDDSRLIITDLPLVLQKAPVTQGDFSMTLYKKKAAKPRTLMQLDQELLGRLDHQELAEHAFSLYQDARKLSRELEEALEVREELRESQAYQHRIIEHLLKELTV
jgi:hypothetical protein